MTKEHYKLSIEKIMKRISIIAVGLLLGTSVFAQETIEAKETTEPETKLIEQIEEKITISGFADVYYSYNMNNPGAYGNWGTNGVGRIFDGQHNQIAFNMFQTKFSYESNRLEIVGDLLFGPGAELANFGNTGTAISIKQAYMAYGVSDKLTFTVGQYGTHIGYELVDSPDNFNYSLSYLFGNGPFYHTGAKLDYAVSDKIGLMAGVVNGWDNLIDNNLSKSVALQLSLTPNDNLSVYINWIGGNEDPSTTTGDSLKSFKHMTDLTLYYAMSEKLNIGLNAAYGLYDYDTLTTKNWGGAAIYLDYSLSDNFAIGLRAEYFEDVSGVQYVGAAYTGFTLTGVIKAANEHFLIKPEIRYDSADRDIYYIGISGKTAATQMTAGISFIAAF